MFVRRFILFAFLVGAAFPPFAQSSTPEDRGLTAEAKVPLSGLSDITTSPDGRRLVTTSGIVDLETGQLIDGLTFDAARGLAFSGDGRHVVYAVKANRQWVPVLDGKKGTFKAYDDVLESYFSPDGQHVAVLAKVGNRQVLSIDGQDSKPYDEIRAPVFDPTGTRAAFVAKVGKQYAVVEDSEDGKGYGEIGALTYSAEVGGFQYLGIQKALQQAAVVSRGKEMRQVPFPDTIKRFGRDLSHYAYVAKAGDKESVVADGVPQKPYDKISEVFLGVDDKRLTFVAKSGSKWLVVVDGKEQTPHDRIVGWFLDRETDGFNALEFSPDGKRIAYAAQDAGKWCVVVDGVEDKPYEKVRNIAFSPDGQHLSYVAHGEGMQRVVIDGKEGKAYHATSPPFFSPDSRRVAHRAWLPKTSWKTAEPAVMVLDEVEGPQYAGVWLSGFSPDSRHFAYVVSKNLSTTTEVSAVIIDGRERNWYAAIGGEAPLRPLWFKEPPSLVFTSPTDLRYFAIKGVLGSKKPEDKIPGVFMVRETIK